MQTQILPELLATAAGREADQILRACVHCGFCNATCPTYQLLGDELDGPRGRIYQIKQVMEGHAPTRITQRHLDRCLTCRSCETTCPSGVHYGRLADIGRHLVEQQVRRPWRERLIRAALIRLVPHRRRFGALTRLGRLMRPLLPGSLASKVALPRPCGPWPRAKGRRKILVLAGCAQSVATPLTNAAAARVLDRLGVDLVESAAAGCCGALAYHLHEHRDGLDAARRNIDAWWPEIESDCEAILVTASGCGVMVKDYGDLLKDDPVYAERAAQVSSVARDTAELFAQLDLAALGQPGHGRRIAFHPPCTLQHGQKLKGATESILSQLGFTLTAVPDAHLCCGSAGTYSITQPELSKRLRENKLAALGSDAPELIATANVGCQLHLEGGSELPVVHWIELLDSQPPGYRGSRA